METDSTGIYGFVNCRNLLFVDFYPPELLYARQVKKQVFLARF